MRKNVAAWGAMVVFILLGALFRALPSGEPLSFRGGNRGTVLVFEGEAGLFSDAFVPSADREYQEPASADRDGTPLSRLTAPPQKQPEKNGRDLDSLKQGVKARKGNPEDMKEYLDEAERLRRERVRKSLEEIRRKVREYEPSVFEPTW
ncbi:hypothetical protein C8D99_101293 [Aminivibrio pyruvatiphilus]|uniref:Uncharacterized protein n=1 Tax=Aminivibrio pyruvatiphilus TaxID=1005740 RepID=A0A4R8MGM5_9BACT|nr:hypothetical protein [Aminivibrio pyruvatiphilus]TDY65143.1 hypothetical protein C8D99_101293 [Aminivibrio pyruvatiphilus]